MASSLLALLDDISTLLDDVATLSKVAVKKTSGVVGDDLALNAQQVTGFSTDRELPVVWAVAKGSLVNKAILVPAALVLSAFLPQLIMPLLMVGGLFLCYEGAHKVIEKLLHKTDPAARQRHVDALTHPEQDLVALERERIAGAIRTDFILSAEIVVIALGTVASAPFVQQVVALSLIGVAITVLVYGLVAGIVKLDDLGLMLHRTEGTDALAAANRRFGAWILRAAPVFLRTLGIVGTIAMFMVGGSIIAHGWSALEHVVHGAIAAITHTGWLVTVLQSVGDTIVGVVAGTVLVGVMSAGSWLRGRLAGAKHPPA